MRTLIGFFLAALSVTGFAATFVFGAALTKECGVSAEVLSFLRFAIAGGTMLAAGLATVKGRARLWSSTRGDWLEMAMGNALLGEGVTGLQWLGTAFIVGSAVIETRRE